MDEKTSTINPQVSGSSIGFNPEYFKCPEGVLKMFQILFGLVVWALTASVGGLCELGSYQFMMFVGVTSWIMTIRGNTLTIMHATAYAHTCFGITGAADTVHFYHKPATKQGIIIQLFSQIFFPLVFRGLFLVFLLQINAGPLSSLPWAVIEFGFNAFWALFYFLGSSVQAAYTCHLVHLVASSIISYLVTLSYIGHANLSFRSWKGHFPWQGGSSGTQVAA